MNLIQKKMNLPLRHRGHTYSSYMNFSYDFWKAKNSNPALPKNI
uniref:Testis cDNA, clone: QtsA-19390, similar to human protein phosphatase 2, regulatory subunit B (B56),epsilon isoform (PPP2R5E) n=1 Tax=Macaca fascicularis TaxID=9541 RepID=Q4R611_MACFA|nr:unnamed protein product [Macaca fascicularis]